MDHAPAIYRRDATGDVKIAEVPDAGDLLQIDYAGDYALYTSYQDDPRYGYKGTSSLVLVNLKDGHRETVLDNGRYYSPKLSSDTKTILAVEFTPDLHWDLIETDLNGQKRNQIRMADREIVEVAYLNPKTAIAITNGRSGEKELIKIDLESKAHKVLLSGSRNTLYAIRTDKGSDIYFEAQYKGCQQYAGHLLKPI